MIETLIDYITYIFTMAGLGNDVLLPSSIQFVINVVMTVPALLYVDRWGRRPTMLAGAFLMMIWLFINAGLLATYGTVPPPKFFPNAAESIRIVGAPAKAVIGKALPVFTLPLSLTILQRALIYLWLPTLQPGARSPGSTHQSGTPSVAVERPSPSQPLQTGRYIQIYLSS